VTQLGGGVLGPLTPDPAASVVARPGFAPGGAVWPGRGPRGGGAPQRAQLTGPDVRDRRENGLEHDLPLRADQIDKRGPPAAIRHQSQVDTGHRLEQLTVNMWWATVTGRRHIDLARIGLGISDELGN